MVLNAASGLKHQGETPERVRDSLAACGVESDIVELRPGLNLRAEVWSRGQPEAIVAAGGDGTVNAVSSIVAGTDIPLGVLPTGTLNHFAKDVGIPPTLEDAARVIGEGNTICVDLGQVNGRTFVNNSSIGLYPEMVRIRGKLMGRGLPKRFATWAGAVGALWRFPNTTVRVTSEVSGIAVLTPLLFVGNNPYEFSGFEAGSRKGLQDAVLQVCTVTNPTRLGLFGTLLSAIGAGSLHGAPELHIMNVQEATVMTFRRNLGVALDGEVVPLRSPLRYLVLPGAMRVFAPRQAS